MNIPKDLEDQCLTLYKDGAGRMDVARHIMSETGLKKTAAKVRAKIVWDNNFGEIKKTEETESTVDEKEKTKSSVKGLEFSNKYIFNSEAGKYVFLLESKIGKNLVLPENTVKSIVKSYSNFNGDPKSINEVAVRYDIPRNFLIEILRCLGITHDSLPVTGEELAVKDEDMLIEEILQEKRFSLNQKLEKQDWKETKDDARRWREFSSGILNPFSSYLDNMDIPTIPEPQSFYEDEHLYCENDTIVIGATDWQVGSSADGRFLFFGEEWSTNKAVEAVEKFSNKVIESSVKRGITKAVIIFGGDIFHGFEGLTAKKTELKCDTFKQDQFDAAVKAVSTLVGVCGSYFESVECKVITGNHEGWTFYPVFKLIESMYSDWEHVSFDICLKEFEHFRVNNAMFITHHGASADYKFKVPTDDKGRIALVQRVMRIAEREGDYSGIKRVFFIKGDTHSFEARDMGQFTFYTFGSLPTGDEYANALALESTPCQNALVIGDDRDYETLHLTF